MIALAMAALIAAAAGQTDFGVRPAPGEETSTPAVEHGDRGHPEGTASFRCTVASVTDGDTFRCSNGLRVRLSAIDTAEMAGSCRPERNCAPGDPHAAKAALAKLVQGRTVSCEAAGKSYNRIAAWCSVGGVDLSCAMVRSGHAVRLEQYDRQKRLCR